MSIAEDINRIKRKELLIAAGEDVADWLAGTVRNRYNIETDVRFLSTGKALDDIVEEYAAAVDSYKLRNNFQTNDLINNYKIAAITIKVLSNTQTDNLFHTSSAAVRASFLFTFSKGLFVYRAAGILMQAPKESMLSHVDFHRDTLHCIMFDKNVSEEWLSCLMHATGIGFGGLGRNM